MCTFLGAPAMGDFLGAPPGDNFLDAPPRGAPPQRVVSLNLCTDQLAMLLAAPGQLISVSRLASDPRSSAMSREAASWPRNAGQAEEIFLLNPDLVLAGRYTARATVSMLERLGIPVQRFDPASGLDEVPDRIAKMGEALGREAAATALIARFEADLLSLRYEVGAARAAIYQANGYTLGSGTMAADIMEAAGLRNVMADRPGGGRLPLELLVIRAPDMLITSTPYPGASRSEEILSHPVLQAMALPRANTGPDWICGTPYVLRAIRDLQEAAR